MKNSVEYVDFDEAGFRAKMRQEQERLNKLVEVEKKTGGDSMAFVTAGRVSGVYLALSYLKEFLVREKK